MPITSKYFPSQISGERVFLLVRRHWIIFVAIAFFITVLLIPILVLIIYWLNSPDIFSGTIGNFVIVFAGIYTLTVWGLLLYGFVNYYLDVYIVTNKRIVDIRQKGFFRREIAELHLHQVQDVDARVEGFFQTLIHFGDIHIQTAGERENFVFQDVPRPYTLAKEIIQLHEAQIESEYEPQIVHHVEKNVDDYRPEDYVHPQLGESVEANAQPKVQEATAINEANDEESEGGIKYLEESYNPEEGQELLQEFGDKDQASVANNQPADEERGFDALDINKQKKSDQKSSEMFEGEEISLDDKYREI
ncbi:MAG: PH domain-containing protein [Candidatus Berkelbacteria bacterium]|nr:PH domain-containing protein [Candidatus Berkelbacteria bacterium]